MTTAQEQPALPGFWEQRTGWKLLKQVLFLEPLPGGSRWAELPSTHGRPHFTSRTGHGAHRLILWLRLPQVAPRLSGSMRGMVSTMRSAPWSRA